MLLPDVNVLVYAHRLDTANHARARAWLTGVFTTPAPFGYSELVLSGFVRVVTHARVFTHPSPVAQAFEFVEQLRTQENAVQVAPGPRHFRVFAELCVKANARGNLVPDAYLAALAIESGSDLVTADRGFSRFPGLRWHSPFEG